MPFVCAITRVHNIIAKHTACPHTMMYSMLPTPALHSHHAAAANRCAWVTGEDIEEEDEEVFSLTHKLPLVVESTRLNMIDKSVSVSPSAIFSCCPLGEASGVVGSPSVDR